MDKEPEVEEPISLDEIREVLVDATVCAEKSRWEPLAALSLYALALSIGRLLEIQDTRR